MVKVQNGWQSRNINELENKSSHEISPISAISSQRRGYEPSLVDAIQTVHYTSPQSPKRVSMANKSDDVFSQTPRIYPDQVGGWSQNEDIERSLPKSQLRATYESFWREHEGVSTSQQFKARSLPIERPALAPPIDLIPRDDHRSGRQLPLMHSQGPYSEEKHRNHMLLDIPITPPPPKASEMRTQSQQAAFEKDAVESLLFMSSPGNSGFHPLYTLPCTLLRNKSAPHASQTDYAIPLERNEERDQGSSVRMIRTTSQPQLLSEADIDKLLDEMPETSSSDEDVIYHNRVSLHSLGE